jgi:hypothetical protein
MYRVFKNHVGGDLRALSNYVDLLVFMSGVTAMPAEITSEMVKAHESSYHITLASPNRPNASTGAGSSPGAGAGATALHHAGSVISTGGGTGASSSGGGGSVGIVGISGDGGYSALNNDTGTPFSEGKFPHALLEKYAFGDVIGHGGSAVVRFAELTDHSSGAVHR